MSETSNPIEALNQGQELTHVQAWKNLGVITSAVSSVLSGLVGIAVSQGWLSDIPPETIMLLSSGLVTLAAGLVTYLQIATTKKLGIAQKNQQGDGVE
jgi:hypothetical protein